MNQPSATESRARSLLADDRSEDALALLRSNLDDPACRASLRDWLLSEQNPAEAAELAVTDDPVDHAFRAHLAGDFENAAELARQALQERPDDHHALLHLARALHNLGHATAALAALEKAVQVRPDFAEAWYALAHALRAGGRMNDAMNCYHRAIEQAPGLRQAWLNLGITRFNLDDAQGALTCFEELLDRDPDDLEALIHSGLTLQLAGDRVAGRAAGSRLRWLPGSDRSAGPERSRATASRLSATALGLAPAVGPTTHDRRQDAPSPVGGRLHPSTFSGRADDSGAAPPL